MNILEEYPYYNADAPWLESHLWPALRSILTSYVPQAGRLFELGCGNGATADMLSQLGYQIIGVDPSESGIRAGRDAYSALELNVGGTYDDLAARYGRFPVVVSLEVIEHCYHPRRFARTVYDLLEDDGLAIISTPFHGYWKNLGISILGRWDQHFDPLWDHGHIKFFSQQTLGALMLEAGFEVQKTYRAGRIRPLAKSMLMVSRRR